MDQNQVAELKHKIALSCRILAKNRMADYLGHVSARIPGSDLILIKGHGLEAGDMAETVAEHIVTVDLDGHLLEGNFSVPYEFAIHGEVYRVRKDVMSVIHTHQIWATVLGIVGLPILPVWHATQCAVAQGTIGLFDDPALIITKEQGQGVAAELGKGIACQLRGHGIVIVGDSVEGATINAIALEKQAQLTYLASLLGQPKQIKEETNPVNSKKSVEGRWQFFVSQVS